MNPPSRMNQAGPNSAMGGAATSPSITNCDISNTTDNTAMFQMPNHQSRQQPQQPPSVQPRGRSREPLAPQPPMFQDANNVRRSPMASARAPAQAGGGGGAVGGYNFQRIMDDHFEHYKRPASRERSVDKVNLPTALSEATNSTSQGVSAPPNIRPRGRSGSRQPLNTSTQPSQPQTSSRAPSRNRTPLPLGTSATDMDLDLRRKELEAKFAASAASTNGDVHEEDPALRFRGQPSQEIAHLGTIPKRTAESLYLKSSLDPKGKDTP